MSTESRMFPLTDEQAAALVRYLQGLQQSAGASPRRLLCWLATHSSVSATAYWRLTQTGALTIPTATGLLEAGVLKSITLMPGEVRVRYASAASVVKRLRKWVRAQSP